MEYFENPDDASTPLTSDERNGLLPTYITTRGELNQADNTTGTSLGLGRLIFASVPPVHLDVNNMVQRNKLRASLR